MKNKTLFTLWGAAFALCAGLGFIPGATGFLRFALMALAVLSFLPPMILISRRSPHILRLIRNLSILSLSLTVALIIANFLSFGATRLVGNVLYSLLVIVSSPMVCGQVWALGLFGWSYLLFASIQSLRRK